MQTVRGRARADGARRLMDIFIDADGCPVKNEVYRVAMRHGLKVLVVSDSRMNVPAGSRVEQIVVRRNLDAADDWIVENVEIGDIVISADIPLAARCLKKGARVLDHRGGEFTEDNIGEALATRELMSHLRDLGNITRGPSGFEKKHRSRFLHRLDEAIRRLRRSAP